MDSKAEAEPIAPKELADLHSESSPDDPVRLIPHPAPKTAQSIRTTLKRSFFLAIVCWVCAPPFTEEKTDPNPPPIIKMACAISTIFNMGLLLRLVTTNKNTDFYTTIRSSGQRLPHSARLTTIFFAGATVVLWMVAATNVGFDLRNQISILTPGPEMNVDGEEFFWPLYFALVGGFLLVLSFYTLAFTLQAILLYKLVIERQAFANAETTTKSSLP